jgi:uncharacterized membrane protein (DUF485 family)
MNQVDHQGQRIIEEFAELKRRFSIVVVLLCLLMLTWLVVAAVFTGRDGVSLFGLPLAWAIEGGLVVAALIGTALAIGYWRCPACGKYLGSVLSMSHCARCGVQLKP